jgi:threonine aldolase
MNSEPSQTLSKTASWVVVRKSDGKPIFEIWQRSVAQKINKNKFIAVPILEYLQSLNQEQSNAH